MYSDVRLIPSAQYKTPVDGRLFLCRAVVDETILTAGDVTPDALDVAMATALQRIYKGKDMEWYDSLWAHLLGKLTWEHGSMAALAQSALEYTCCLRITLAPV
jgi:hypothetical protein